ncbi:MAG TPA: isoleucine--tRNA ligase, partial [Planctomycetaceae bacterium]|nr:isoleucine--tRNA ligase [Planctomycetaceae bacterium]
LQQADASTLMTSFQDDGQAVITLQDRTDISITEEECLIRTTAREGWAAAEGTRGVVVISSELTPALIAEGRVRDVIHTIQSQRKTVDLEFTDRIALGFVTESDELRTALQEHVKTIASETLAASIGFERIPDAEEETLDLDGHALTITLKRIVTPETA